MRLSRRPLRATSEVAAASRCRSDHLSPAPLRLRTAAPERESFCQNQPPPSIKDASPVARRGRRGSAASSPIVLNHREVEADIMAALAASTAAAAHDARERGSGLAAAPPQDDITPKEIIMCMEDDRRTREEAEEAERLAGEEAVRSVEAMKRADRATRRAKAEREAGGEQHEQHQEYAMGSSASRAGAGDFEVRGGWESRSR